MRDTIYHVVEEAKSTVRWLRASASLHYHVTFFLSVRCCVRDISSIKNIRMGSRCVHLKQNGLVLVTVSRMDGTTPQGVVALDITNGNRRWTRPLPAGPGAGGRAQIAIGSSYIYVNNSDGQIQVWQSSDGKPVTTLTIPAPVSDSLNTVAMLTVVPWPGK
jgi:putative pyrroloquinoline-quinone binding quinoprotein